MNLIRIRLKACATYYITHNIDKIDFLLLFKYIAIFNMIVPLLKHLPTNAQTHKPHITQAKIIL